MWPEDDLPYLDTLNPADQLWVVALAIEEAKAPARYVAVLRAIAEQLEVLGQASFPKVHDRESGPSGRYMMRSSQRPPQASDTVTLPKPLLWIPAHYVEREQQHLAAQQPESFLRVALGYEEVFGIKPSWDQLRARLGQYSLGQVLGALGRIGGILERFGQRHSEGQKRIVDGLFGDKGPVIWQAMLAWRERDRRLGGPEATPTLFHELQLITLAKVALLVIDVRQGEGSPSLTPLAEALLMLNNLQQGVLGTNPVADPSTPEGMRVWHQYFIANGLFHHGGTDVHSLPRAYELYLTDKPHLRAHPAYVDLPAAIRELTGLEPDTLWFILFAFMAHWMTIEPEAIASGTWMMSRSRYFSALNFSPHDRDRFLDLVSVPAPSMKREVEKCYSVDTLRPFHVLPFARWPLIAIGDNVCCTSVKLLKEKLTSGLHHLFLDEATFSKAQRSRYLTFMGAVFQDYVSRLLARVYPAFGGRYLGPEELAASLEGKSCDFVLLYGDAVVLLEVKATRFSLAARTEEGWADYERQFKDIFIDGAAQMDDTVDAIQAGRLLGLGVDPVIVRSYFPLIVTLEDLPMNRAIYQKVREDLGQAGLLQQPRVRPLQAIDVGELEFLEIALEAGRSLREILQEKLSSEEGRDQSMGNYLLLKDEPFMKGQVNAYLGDLFRRLGDQAVQAFRNHKKAASLGEP